MMIPLIAIALILVFALQAYVGFVWAIFAVLGFFATGMTLLALIGRRVAMEKPATASTPAQTEQSKQPLESAHEDTDPIELSPAIKAFEQGAYERSIALAAPFLHDQGDSLRIDALRLTAFGHTRLGDHKAAHPFWLAVIQDSALSSDYLNAASNAAMAARFDEARPLFDQCMRRYTEEAGGDPDQALAFNGFYQANFLSSLAKAGRADLAFEYLQPLADFYCSLRVTDSTFLHIRKMPFFSVFLEQSLPLVRKVLNEPDLVDWYRNIYRQVDDEGRTLFNRYHVPH